MKYNIQLLAISSALFLASFDTYSAELYQESFDSQSTAKVAAIVGTDSQVSFVDYTNFQVGSTTHNIAEAPRPIQGSPAGKGVLIRNKYLISPTLDQRLANLVAVEEAGGARLAFNGNYRVSFDMYLSVSPTATRSSTGTTELGVWGVGWDGQRVLGRLTRNSTSPAIVGTYGWLATEGGNSTDDASLRIHPSGGTATSFSKGDTTDVALFSSTWPNTSPIATDPNNSWTQVDIDVTSGWIFVRYNGQEWFRQQSNATSGSIVLGYEDPFASISFAPDYQWALFDNWKVEEIPPLSLIVTQPQPFPTVYSASSSSQSQFHVENATTSPIEIQGASFTGADADDFALSTSLPIIIQPGSAIDLDVAFSPQNAVAGERKTTLVLQTNSTEAPTVPSSQFSATVILPSFLQAHYKLDEVSGSVVTDSSSQKKNGTYQTNQTGSTVAHAQPSITTPPSGTAVGITPANSGVGNYLTSGIDLSPSFTISLWFKLTTPQAPIAVDQTLFQRAQSFSSRDSIYGCSVTPDGKLVLNIAKTTSTDSPIIELEANTIQVDTPYHLVVTHADDDGLSNNTALRTKIYLNGELKAAKEGAEAKGFNDYPTTAAASVRQLFLGSRSAAGTGMNGLLDDIQIYGAELTEYQVFQLFGNPGINTVNIQEAPNPEITNFVRDQASGDISFKFPSFKNLNYAVLASSSLETNSWIEVVDNLRGELLETAYSSSIYSSEPKMFFKIEPR